MILLVDESVDRQVVDRLREDGHTVSYVAEMDPGISDDDVLSLANEKEAVLLTADKISLALKKHSKGMLSSFSVITPSSIRIREPS